MTRKQTILLILAMLIVVIILVITYINLLIPKPVYRSAQPIEPPKRLVQDFQNSFDKTEPNTLSVSEKVISIPEESPLWFASITFQLASKTKSYEVKPDVSENTLKKHIGHLPASGLPGELGTCVLMGHRDTALKVLKGVHIGSEIIMEHEGKEYAYEVADIYVIDKDAPLTFTSSDEALLVLVTCYPFDYLGPAPEQLIITCKLK